MLRDMTLGRYYDSSSFLHSLDPRTKLVALPVLVVGIFMSASAATCILTVLCITALIALCKVPLRFMVRGLSSALVFLVAVFILNAVLVHDGFWRSVLICLRVIEVVFVSNLLCLTTRPRSVANGVETGLYWMRHLKVPVHDLATIVSIAFRFVPILADEANRIMDAQISRGADYRTGNLVRKAKASVSVIVPMFVSAVRRSEELAVAMDSRLYGSDEPSHLHSLKYTYKDAAAYICIFTYLCVCILMKAGGL